MKHIEHRCCLYFFCTFSEGLGTNGAVPLVAMWGSVANSHTNETRPQNKRKRFKNWRSFYASWWGVLPSIWPHFTKEYVIKHLTIHFFFTWHKTVKFCWLVGFGDLKMQTFACNHLKTTTLPLSILDMHWNLWYMHTAAFSIFFFFFLMDPCARAFSHCCCTNMGTVFKRKTVVM